ncbi:MAG: FlgD immunoglobulin-like domain containing protein [Candidatus Hydrogenedentota bacterium]
MDMVTKKLNHIFLILNLLILSINLSADDTGIVGITKSVTPITGQDMIVDTVTYTDLQLGQEIDLGVYADTISGQLWAYSFNLNYTTSILELISAPSQSWFFIYGVPLNADSTVFADTIRDGVIEVFCCVKDEKDSLTGEGMMTTFKFRTKASATTTVTLSNIYLFFLDDIYQRDTVPISINSYNLLSLTLAQAQGSLSNFTVYPNPYRPNDGDANTGKTYSSSDPTSGIVFAGLTNPVQIRIYTISGELVRVINFSGGAQYNWDVKNDKGHEVASGLYIYTVTSATGEKKTGKLMVIR